MTNIIIAGTRDVYFCGQINFWINKCRRPVIKKKPW